MLEARFSSVIIGGAKWTSFEPSYTLQEGVIHAAAHFAPCRQGVRPGFQHSGGAAFS